MLYVIRSNDFESYDKTNIGLQFGSKYFLQFKIVTEAISSFSGKTSHCKEILSKCLVPKNA